MMEHKRAISPYADYSRSKDIHGTALYPGVMVAPMQRDVLSEYICSGSPCTVLDPFVGSGTALYESLRLNNQVTLIGSDINPLAILITRVKIEGVNGKTIRSDLDAVKAAMTTNKNDDSSAWTFHNSDKWFKPEISKSLTCVRNAVRCVQDNRNRRFFWYMMIDIVRKYCNSRSSTYKLHVRPQDQINRIEDGVIQDYLSKVDVEYKLFLKRSTRAFKLNQGDSIDYLRSMGASSVDVCVTSPPYGDNSTTIPYGQYSMLAMSWIDPHDLGLSGWELDTYSAIDSRSLGGCKSPASAATTSIHDETITRQIESITNRKRKKVIRFMKGYQQFLDEAYRVTKNAMIITLGNRTVDGIRIDLTGFTKRYLESQGCPVSIRAKRPIKHKRTPSNVSRVNGAPVRSMNEEYILVADCASRPDL